MKKSPLACVHCPHCDYHISTWGDVQEAMKQAQAAGIEPSTGWAICIHCETLIQVNTDGEHVMPEPDKVAAQPEPVKAAIEQQMWIIKTTKEGLRRGLLLGFKNMTPELLAEHQKMAGMEPTLPSVSSGMPTVH